MARKELNEAVPIRRPRAGFLLGLGAIKWISRSNQATLGVIIMVIFVLIGTFGPWIAPYGQDEQNLRNRNLPPFWAEKGKGSHLLGTDQFGRDMLSRLIYGARVSLLVGIVAVVASGSIGIMIGLSSGYLGGWVDAVLMRLADFWSAFPYILLAIIILSFLGAGLWKVILVLSIGGWVSEARTVRGVVLSAKEEQYVLAAKAIGATHLRIVARHLLPNVLAPVLVFGSFRLASVILAEATLSFLGLGVQPPTATWGSMLSRSREYMVAVPHLVIAPGVCLTLVALGANQLGDGLRDLLDPRLRGSLGGNKKQRRA